jgi:hypothetical protein
VTGMSGADADVEAVRRARDILSRTYPPWYGERREIVLAAIDALSARLAAAERAEQAVDADVEAVRLRSVEEIDREISSCEYVLANPGDYHVDDRVHASRSRARLRKERAYAARLAAAERERDEWKEEAGRRGWPKDAAQEFHRMKYALGAIASNAESWHGNGEEGPRRALAVIAGWARDPATVPVGIGAVAPETVSVVGEPFEFETPASETYRAALDDGDMKESDLLAMEQEMLAQAEAAEEEHKLVKSWHSGGSVVGALCSCGWEGTIWEHPEHAGEVAPEEGA